jgi:hypothetical protein
MSKQDTTEPFVLNDEDIDKFIKYKDKIMDKFINETNKFIINEMSKEKYENKNIINEISKEEYENIFKDLDEKHKNIFKKLKTQKISLKSQLSYLKKR